MKYEIPKPSYSVLGTIIFLTGSIVISYEAMLYATSRASNTVTDIILSNIPQQNVDTLFFWCTIGMLCAIAYVSTRHMGRITFIGNTIALFFCIRSLFVCLTHIAPLPSMLHSPAFGGVLWQYLSGFFTGSDLFFSGHTGLPFLCALIFWNSPTERYFFLALSVFFAIIVLLGHMHYSIDVAAAYFITYSIFILSTRVFTIFLED
jgi:membrane-associated phospholipid phosphatase